jgi:hypothetical protein
MFGKENLLLGNVRHEKFDPSLDLAGRDFESIYAEGEKIQVAADLATLPQ